MVRLHSVETKAITKKHNIADLHAVRVGDYVYGHDGTQYLVLTIHQPMMVGRHKRGRSLTLLNQLTGRGTLNSVEEWHSEGVYALTNNGETSAN